jgi:hypothetical protein
MFRRNRNVATIRALETLLITIEQCCRRMRELLKSLL